MSWISIRFALELRAAPGCVDGTVGGLSWEKA
jgi:hypothetical protein